MMISNRAYRITGIVLALVFLGIGIGLIVYGSRMKVSPLYYRSGPQLFPMLIGGLTAVVGLCALVEALKGRLLPRERLEMQLPAGVLMASGLLFQIFTIQLLGWVATATIVLVAGAQAFRRDRILLDILVGLIVATVTYFFFSRLLGLRLPVGTLFG